MTARELRGDLTLGEYFSNGDYGSIFRGDPRSTPVVIPPPRAVPTAIGGIRMTGHDLSRDNPLRCADRAVPQCFRDLVTQEKWTSIIDGYDEILRAARNPTSCFCCLEIDSKQRVANTGAWVRRLNLEFEPEGLLWGWLYGRGYSFVLQWTKKRAAWEAAHPHRRKVSKEPRLLEFMTLQERTQHIAVQMALKEMERRSAGQPHVVSAAVAAAFAAAGAVPASPRISDTSSSGATGGTGTVASPPLPLPAAAALTSTSLEQMARQMEHLQLQVLSLQVQLQHAPSPTPQVQLHVRSEGQSLSAAAAPLSQPLLLPQPSAPIQDLLQLQPYTPAVAYTHALPAAAAAAAAAYDSASAAPPREMMGEEGAEHCSQH